MHTLAADINTCGYCIYIHNEKIHLYKHIYMYHIINRKVVQINLFIILSNDKVCVVLTEFAKVSK